jgi:hypothetical protein
VIISDEKPAGMQFSWDLGRPGVKLMLAFEDVPAGTSDRPTVPNPDEVDGKWHNFENVLMNLVPNEAVSSRMCPWENRAWAMPVSFVCRTRSRQRSRRRHLTRRRTT